MNDLISRQALRSEMYHEAFEKDSNEQRWDSGCWIRYKMFERVVDRLPSAQRTGRWIYNDEAYPGGNPYGHYECDQCGEYVPHKTNYCPNCGCAMEGEEE